MLWEEVRALLVFLVKDGVLQADTCCSKAAAHICVVYSSQTDGVIQQAMHVLVAWLLVMLCLCYKAQRNFLSLLHLAITS